MAPAEKIRCDCCGDETMAEIKDNKIVIIDRRHGKRHMVVLTLEEIIKKMNDAAQSAAIELHKWTP